MCITSYPWRPQQQIGNHPFTPQTCTYGVENWLTRTQDLRKPWSHFSLLQNLRWNWQNGLPPFIIRGRQKKSWYWGTNTIIDSKWSFKSGISDRDCVIGQNSQMCLSINHASCIPSLSCLLFFYTIPMPLFFFIRRIFNLLVLLSYFVSENCLSPFVVVQTICFWHGNM